MLMDRLLKVATPALAFTGVVPLRVPLEGLVPMAMPIEAVLFATNLLPESRTLTVTAGLIEAPAALFVGCCKKARWSAAPKSWFFFIRDVPEGEFDIRATVKRSNNSEAVALTKLTVIPGGNR